MKKFLLMISAAVCMLLSSCVGPEGPMGAPGKPGKDGKDGIGEMIIMESYVEANEWYWDDQDKYWVFDFDDQAFETVDEQLWEKGIIVGYVYDGDVICPLPRTRIQYEDIEKASPTAENPDNKVKERVYWTQTIDFEYGKDKKISVYITNDNGTKDHAPKNKLVFRFAQIER